MLTEKVTLCVPLMHPLRVELGQALNVKVTQTEGEKEYSAVLVELVV